MSYEERVRDQIRANDARRKKRQQAQYEQYRTKTAERERMRESESEFARQLAEYEATTSWSNGLTKNQKDRNRYTHRKRMRENGNGPVLPLQPCPPKTLTSRPPGLSDRQWKRMREKANRKKATE